MTNWTLDKIKSILPQREPFLFVDEVVEAVAGEYVVAQKKLTGDEDFFKGHFPGNPIMPGVLTAEALAQTAIILYAITKPEIAKAKPTYFLGKTEIKYKAPAVPGDTITLTVRAVKMLTSSGVVEAEAKVGETIIATGTLFFGVK